MNNRNGTQLYRLPRDGNGLSDIEFTGRKTASVNSDPSELGDRWTELNLYETLGGKFVSQSIGKSSFQDEAELSSCKVYDTVAEACEFFTVKGRVTWLSRQMFSAITEAYPGFDKVERVG